MAVRHEARRGHTHFPKTPAEKTAGVQIIDEQLAPGNVLRYGKNTIPGTTDMATAINNALKSNSYVWWEGDTLGIGSKLIIPPFVTLQGIGWGGSQTVIKQISGSNITEALIVSKGWDDDNTVADGPVTLKDFFLDGNKANNTSATTHGVELMTFQSRVQDMQVFGTTGDGIRLTDQNKAGTSLTGTAVENSIIHCRITNVDGSGIREEDNTGLLSDTQIKDNIVGSTGEWGIIAETGAKIQDNHIYNTGFDGIAGQDGFNTIITGNSIQDWGQAIANGTRYACVIFGALNANPSLISGNDIEISTVEAGSTYYVFGATFASGNTTGVVNIIGNSVRLNGAERVLNATGSGTGIVNLTNNEIDNAGATLIVRNANVVVHEGNSTDREILAFSIVDTTPSVLASNIFKTADTTTFTDFDDPYEGQVFKLLALHAATITDGANIKTSTGANKTLTVDVMYEFTSIGGVWYETATA